MRPSPDELLMSLRVSLNDGLLPHVTDRWARYVGTAMDLVLQHLQLRLAGELDAIEADNADMAATLANVASRGNGSRWVPPLDALPEPAELRPGSLTSATELNETLRGQVVAVLRWLDATDPDGQDDELRAVRDDVHRLIRRQVDRINPLVEPLYMSFRPAAAAQ